MDCDVHLKSPVRVWYFSVQDELLKRGCIQSKADLSLLYWYHDNKLAGLFLMHVDDFFWGGNSAFRVTVISKIQIGKEESGIFKGHVKIILLPVIALPFPHFCPNWNRLCTYMRNSIPDMLVIFCFENSSSKYLKMLFYALESFPINCLMSMVLVLKLSVTNW